MLQRCLVAYSAVEALLYKRCSYLNTPHASENSYTARVANAADRKFKSEVHQPGSELLTAFATIVKVENTVCPPP
jgi:hypothetical protein